MLVRLAHLAAANTLALLRLLPMSDRDEEIEILALRHQLLVLQRQVGKPAFTDTDRAILAGLLHHLPKDTLRSQAGTLLACDFFETPTSSRPAPRPGHACTSSPSSSTPPGASGSWASLRTPPRSGWCSSDAISSWTSRTRAAGPGC
ncbi:hypothetical protein GCM10012280_58190 [Wenjunlia tyrosinilytica]|uniref:Uncharacterized protein n=1 Tax=Wenjunlia tyrosinilytica TaxID=1544741 RepID=A0A918E0H1_9ACTN|nr:hypothetical protein GCM10012280_58190 [Wenjunlia tyrosinilytica]